MGQSMCVSPAPVINPVNSRQRVIVGGVVGVGESSATTIVCILNDKNVILRVIDGCRPATVHCKMNCRL